MHKEQLLLSAFVMNCVGHIAPGLWRHPRDRSRDYKSLAHWTELARTLERGKFDAIFIADAMGVYDVFGQSPDAALRHATQVPNGDPLMLVSAMAAATSHLGFGVTANLSYEHPYSFARRMSTLDHLTDGRIGWNVVTGFLDSAARGMGLPQQGEHDGRYDVADEFMKVAYRFWEESWEDDAVFANPGGEHFADPRKIHRITHNGDAYRTDAVHLCEPSPQRTPVIFQAGTSSRGRQFAARHAECVFLSGPTKEVVASRVADIRKAAQQQGRSRSQVKILALATLIVASTDEEARQRHAEYLTYVSHEGALALMSGWTGVDLSRLSLDDEVRYVENDAGRTALENITRADPSRTWTVREVAEHTAIGSIGPVIVGSPARVADELEYWRAQTDVDGFNLGFAVMPESFADVVDLLIPELQRRGIYKNEYATGSLRHKLFGAGHSVPGNHPAAAPKQAGTQTAAFTAGERA
ncbi:MAG: LLM class flavin-dependent oxidoreductase [Polaromonas sp.]|nr:LLM class flavin-dependent oxidoreductase [Polaromonas sp.]